MSKGSTITLSYPAVIRLSTFIVNGVSIIDHFEHICDYVLTSNVWISGHRSHNGMEFLQCVLACELSHDILNWIFYHKGCTEIRII